MKHFATLLLIVVVFSGFNRAQSQALQITPGDTAIYNGMLTDSNGSAPVQNIYLVNNTSDSEIYWQVLTYTEDSSWQMSFCDPNNCYYYSVGNGTGNIGINHFLAFPNSTSKVDFSATPYCMADSGKMAVRIWVAHDSVASAKTLYFFAAFNGVCVSGIQNIARSNLRIYPSPVISNMAVEGLNAYNNVKLTVYDVLGNAAIQKNITQPGALINVNTDALHAGIYIVSIEGDGTKLLTKRIEKLEQ